MTDEEILIKAVQRAIFNGCDYSTYQIDFELFMQKKLYYSIIFAHDFAKAFWGEMEFERIGGVGEITGYKNRGWEYHLQQMITYQNPLKYLEKFL